MPMEYALYGYLNPSAHKHVLGGHGLMDFIIADHSHD